MKHLYNDDSIIRLRMLLERKEDDRYIIGNEDTEIYVSISQTAYDILKLFKRGLRVRDIKHIVREKYSNVNINAFINNLLRHDFVSSIGSRQMTEKLKSKVKPMFSFIKPKHVKFLFNPAAYCIYAFIIFYALAILLLNPHYLPQYSDYFFIKRLAILAPLSFIFGWLLVFLHEFAHYLAARSLNITASFGIANRLYFLVAITDVTNVYKVERKKRYKVYLAGIISDILVVAVSIIFLFFFDLGILHFSPILYLFLKFIILLEFLGIAWQFYFFLRTDIYYVFENMFRINNLSQKTSLMLRNLFTIFSKKHHHFRIRCRSERELKLVRFYSVFYALGIIASMLMLLFYEMPIAFLLIGSSIQKLFIGAMFSIRTMLYDASIFLFFWLINQALLLYALIRHYKLYLKPMFYWLAIFLLLITNYVMILLIIILILINIKSSAVIYAILVLLGVLFGITLLWLVEKLNRISREVILEIFTPVITIIVSMVIVSFTRYFINAVNIATPIASTLPLIALAYACGIAVAYMIMLPSELHKKLVR